MPIKIIKQLAIQEDIEWGIGEITQPRDTDGDGITEDVVYNKVNDEIIPTLLGDGITESTVRVELLNRYTKGEADAKFALIAGDALQVFSAADPTLAEHVVNKGYLETYAAGQLSSYALKTEVLLKDNLNAYSPTSDYHPATKKYVDDTVIDIGAGDMAKGVYDNNDNGVVDDSELFNGKSHTDFMMYRGPGSDMDLLTSIGYWSVSGALNAPTAGAGIVTVSSGDGLVSQSFSDSTNESIHIRTYSGVSWSDWRSVDDTVTVVDVLTSTSTEDALSANQGRILAEQLEQSSNTNVPVGGIIMWDGSSTNQIPNNWAICDGNNGTPDLVDRFVMGSSSLANNGLEGGTLASTMPNHSHTATHSHSGSANSAGSHRHTESEEIARVAVRRYDGGTPYSAPSTGDGYTGYAGTHSHSVTVNSTDVVTSDAYSAGDNRPPYYTLIYIKRLS